jgi:hypothetical protein
MTRNMACSLALGALALLVPTTGSAQTFVDVGVWTRGGGGRVVVGGAPVYAAPVYAAPVYYPEVYYPPVYYARPVYRPVYVAQPYYRHDRGRHRGWAKKGYAPYAPYAAYGPYVGGGYYAGYRDYDGRRDGRRDYRRR